MGETPYQVEAMKVEAFYRVHTKPIVLHTFPFCFGISPRQNQEIKVAIDTKVICLAVRRIPGSRYAHRVDPWAHKLKVIEPHKPWLQKVGWYIGSESNMIERPGMTDLDRHLLMQVLDWTRFLEIVR